MNAPAGSEKPDRPGALTPRAGYPNLKTYAALAAAILLARLSLALWPAQAVVASQAAALSWPALALNVALGYGGLFLARRAGFPPLISRGAPDRSRWLFPALGGLVAGAIFILLDLAYRLPADLNVSFPQSIPFYLAGGFFVEVILHLLPLSVFVWLFGAKLLGEARLEPVFWIVAGLTAALEPLMQFTLPPFSRYPVSFVLLGGLALYLINLTQLYFFKRAGFFALLSYRWSFYLLWHILWGPLRLAWMFGN